MTPANLTGRRLYWPSLLPALLALGLALPAPAQTVSDAATQPLAEIATVAEDYARTLMQDPVYAAAEVSAGALDARLRLKLCEKPLETFSNNTDIRGGRLTVGVRCTGVAPWTLYVPVAIAAKTSIVVIDGPLPRGTLLTEANLRLEQRALTALPPQYLTSVDQVLGRELTRAVNGATVATPAMLQARDLVAKGQDVVIMATGSSIQVRMAGVALQKGQQGERINVQNTTSGKTIQAVIVDGATVQVAL
jgi:flagella basal body P-ring formation protein FlgA